MSDLLANIQLRVFLLCAAGSFALILQGCQTAAEPTPTASETPAATEVPGPIGEFNNTAGELELSFQNLNQQIIDNPGETAAAAMQQLGAEDQSIRFAALYALANTAESEEHLNALRGFLDSAVAGERLLAAEALLMRGDKIAIPVLIVALNSEEELIYSLPVQQAWERGRELLLLFTIEDFGLADAESFTLVAAAQPAWLDWWQQNGEALQWIAEEGVYR